MAYISVLILNLLLLALVGMLALGIALSAACVVLVLRYRKRKKSGGSPVHAKEKRLSLLCGILAVADFCFLGGVAAFSLRPQTAFIESAGGGKTVLQSAANDFEKAIAADDAERVAAMLGQTPELIGYVTFEGYCPLGAAIRYGSTDVAAYLLKSGVDVDRVDPDAAESSVSLLCRVSSGPTIDVEMLGLLLDYGAQVNGTQNALPSVQFVLRHICADQEISESDLTLFGRFLDRGADLSVTNGKGEDSAAYFERLVAEGGIEERQPDAVHTVREWIAENRRDAPKGFPLDSGQ